MKTRSPFKTRRFFLILCAAGILGMAGVALPNLDLLLRTFHSYQNKTLTTEKFRLDLASYDILQDVPPIPDNARLSAADEMLLVLVPAGEFTMGRGADGWTFEHQVYLDTYWMDRYEVTNAMYARCVAARGCTPPSDHNKAYGDWVYRNHPVTYVTWYQASTYCEWAGRRLPTEAEWEKAGRGTDGRIYPWGNTKPNARFANFADALIHEALPVYRYTLGASPYGVLNLAGNAREWVSDWFDPRYYFQMPYANPQGPATGTEKSLRGGSYNEDAREIMIFRRYKHDPDSPGLSRGFRCAQSSDE